MSKLPRRILCISDLHAPFSHPDARAFLEALKRKYKPDKVVCLGDEIDHHAMSFHDSDPDLPSAGHELDLAISYLEPLYKLFPKVEVLESNHGSMLYRKSKHYGVPRKYLRDYREILEAPKGWTWHQELIVKVPGGNKVLFRHGLASNVMQAVAKRGMCVVQGHFHSRFEIGYLGNPDHLLWGMTAGCLIFNKSPAFEYDSHNLNRPIIGLSIIIDGLPKLLPMILNKKGRWNGYVP